MMKRAALALALVVTFIPAAYAGCMSDLCGSWASGENGTFVVNPQSLIWNKHEFRQCLVEAQDPRISILQCKQVHNVGSDVVHNLTVYFYLRRISNWSMQVIYANEMPEGCVAATTCWPGSGMFFRKVIKDAGNSDALPESPPAPAPSANANSDAAAAGQGVKP